MYTSIHTHSAHMLSQTWSGLTIHTAIHDNHIIIITLFENHGLYLISEISYLQLILVNIKLHSVAELWSLAEEI